MIRGHAACTGQGCPAGVSPVPRSGAVRVAAASAARLVSGSETPGTACAEAVREPRHFFHRWAFPWVSISRGSAQGREPSPSLAWLRTKSCSRSPLRVNPPRPSAALCGAPRAFSPLPGDPLHPEVPPGPGSQLAAQLRPCSQLPSPLWVTPPAVSPPLSAARCSQLSPCRRGMSPLTSLSCPHCWLRTDMGGATPVSGLPGDTPMILG